MIKKTAKIHMRSGLNPEIPLCFFINRFGPQRLTDNPEKVTCNKCLKIMRDGR